MVRLRSVLAFSFLGVLMAASTVYAGGPAPFIGLELGASEPTNSQYRAHVQTGVGGSPFAGYMFNDYLGLQGGLHAMYQEPDSDGRGSSHENQTTTIVGGTVGPRLQLPLGDLFDADLTAQGGGFKGVSGRLNQWAPGFLAGGGLDFNVTKNFSIGLFGRWNRAYMSPHPTFTNFNIDVPPDERGKDDIQWVTAGMGIKYTFAQAAPPPPPPPPPPPVAKPAPPMKKKIVLRAVHFDFDKSNIRRDAVPILDEAVRILKDEGIMAVISEGHTDAIGTAEYNLKLSRRRASAVKKYLVDHGVPESHIKVEGFGKSKPVATNDTDDGRAQNRRVELKVE